MGSFDERSHALQVGYARENSRQLVRELKALAGPDSARVPTDAEVRDIIQTWGRSGPAPEMMILRARVATREAAVRWAESQLPFSDRIFIFSQVAGSLGGGVGYAALVAPRAWSLLEMVLERDGSVDVFTVDRVPMWVLIDATAEAPGYSAELRQVGGQQATRQ